MKTKHKKKILYISLIVLIFLMPHAGASIIRGFSQLRYGSDLSINSSTLNIMTANTSRIYITQLGLVGINTTSPAQTLTVQGTFNVTAAGQGATPSLFADSSGNVGIGTTAPSQALEVNGHINITGTSSNSTFNGDVRVLGTLYGGSPLKIAGGLNVTSGQLIFSDGTTQSSGVASLHAGVW